LIRMHDLRKVKRGKSKKSTKKRRSAGRPWDVVYLPKKIESFPVEERGKKRVKRAKSRKEHRYRFWGRWKKEGAGYGWWG